MCDYSLESYKSRAAVDGEDLVIKAFPSGSKGFVEVGKVGNSGYADADWDCAVCCQDGVEMTLHLKGRFETRPIVEKKLGSPARDEEFDGEVSVTFHTLEKLAPLPWGGVSYGYRDGFILPNGRFLSVQRLIPGTRATVTKALPKELSEAVKGGVASKDDIEVRVADVAPLAPAHVD